MADAWEALGGAESWHWAKRQMTRGQVGALWGLSLNLLETRSFT